MQIIFEGKNISSDIKLVGLSVIDPAGGSFGSVEIEFSDINNLWSLWAPVSGNSIEINCESNKSGICYVDQIGQGRGTYILRALTAPISAKQPQSHSWENVTLHQVVYDVAQDLGFGVSMFGVESHVYTRIDQINESGLQLLSRLCEREDYSVKVYDQKIIIFNNQLQFEAMPIATLDVSDFLGEPEYYQEADNYSCCRVSYGSISALHGDSSGNCLNISSVAVSNVGEAQRFAKSFLNNANRSCKMLRGTIILNLDIVGGCTLTVVNIGTADGKYFVSHVEHNLVESKSILQLIKI